MKKIIKTNAVLQKYSLYGKTQLPQALTTRGGLQVSPTKKKLKSFSAIKIFK